MPEISISFALFFYKKMAESSEFEPPVVCLVGPLSATTYIFETFLNSFQNLKSISQNAHWLKKR